MPFYILERESMLAFEAAGHEGVMQSGTPVLAALLGNFSRVDWARARILHDDQTLRAQER